MTVLIPAGIFMVRLDRNIPHATCTTTPYAAHAHLTPLPLRYTPHYRRLTDTTHHHTHTTHTATHTAHAAFVRGPPHTTQPHTHTHCNTTALPHHATHTTAALRPHPPLLAEEIAIPHTAPAACLRRPLPHCTRATHTARCHCCLPLPFACYAFCYRCCCRRLPARDRAAATMRTTALLPFLRGRLHYTAFRYTSARWVWIYFFCACCCLQPLRASPLPWSRIPFLPPCYTTAPSLRAHRLLPCLWVLYLDCLHYATFHPPPAHAPYRFCARGFLLSSAHTGTRLLRAHLRLKHMPRRADFICAFNFLDAAHCGWTP